MHPLFSAPRQLMTYLLAWGLAGLLLAAFVYGNGQASVSAALLFALPLCGLLGFVALSAYHVCRSRPAVGRQWWPLAAGWAGACLVAALLWWAAAVAWNSLGELAQPGSPLVQMSPVAWRLWALAGGLLYLLSLLTHEVVVGFERVRAAEQAQTQARLLARDAELQLLRTQVDPHFLFNSLNAISALTTLNPAAARDMAIDLAQFFRSTLALAERERITLAEEVALCQHFVAIEQRRLGDKLACTWQLDPQALRCELPPMLLQPLLENAIKHGVRLLHEGGTVQVEATINAGGLQLVLRNPVAATRTLQPGARDVGGEGGEGDVGGLGLGLRNLRERLRLHYGARARLGAQLAGGCFTVTLTLPPTPGVPA